MSSVSKVIYVLDGGFSGQLSKYVGDKVDGDPLWTARFLQIAPEAIIKTHFDYLKAGADIISTNTYQASVPGFVKYLGLSEADSYNLIMKAVYLAKKAKERYINENKSKSAESIRIIGSVGPYGAYLHDGSEYSGSYSENITKKQLIIWHKPRIQALIEAGLTLLAFETIPSEKEADALMELLDEYPGVKAWISFSCKDSEFIVNGQNFQSVATKIWHANKDKLIAVGANCLSPYNVSKLFYGINSGDQNIPMVVYPNSGESFSPESGWNKSNEHERTLDSFVHEWLDLGVKYIGSCCRTYPIDIAAIKDKVNTWSYKLNNP